MLPTEYAGTVLSEVDGLVLIRALQHERSDMIALAVVAQCPWGPMQSEIAKRYVGEAYGKVADKGLRQKLLRQEMTARSLQSIQRRTFEESAEAQTLRCKILMCEYYSSIATQNSIEFGPDILIYSDSNEIQFDTIAKRVLGLSD